MFNRRKFITVLSAIGTGSFFFNPTFAKKKKTMIVHQVFFWLHQPEKDLKAVIDGCEKIAQTQSVKDYHVGVPAPTARREVVDHSFHVSLTVHFDSVEDHDLYQEDPIHLEFIAQHKDKWAEVKVYDFEV